MNTLYEINKEIFQLRKEQKYDEVLEVYKNKVHKHFQQSDIIGSDYLVANVVHCLRKSGKTMQAIDFVIRSLNYFPGLNEHTQTHYELGWALYQHLKKTEINTSQNQLPNYIATAIKMLRSPLWKENYLLFSKLYLMLSKKMMVKGEAVKALDQLSDTLDAKMFDHQPKTTTLQKGGKEKNIELASDYETYMVRRSKSLLLNERYEECIAHCNQTLEKISRFHQGNQLWIARNLAMAWQQTGQTNKAIEKMKEVAQSKKDWYLYHELAQMMACTSKTEQALQWYCKAALRQGNTHYKTGLYENMIRFFAENKYDDQPICQHINLANTIRKEQNWKIPTHNTMYLQKRNCDQNSNQSSSDIYKELSRWWQTKSAETDTEEATTGTITRILNNDSNGDGFITTTDGRSIYFRFKKAQLDPSDIQTGLKVKLKAMQRMFKGKEVWNAVWVKKAAESKKA